MTLLAVIGRFSRGRYNEGFSRGHYTGLFRGYYNEKSSCSHCSTRILSCRRYSLALPRLYHEREELLWEEKDSGPFYPEAKPFQSLFKPEKLQALYGNVSAAALAENPPFVSTAGRILSFREMGSRLIFFDLYHDGEHVQVIISKDYYSSCANDFDKCINSLQRGDLVLVDGNVCRTRAGELSVKAKKVEISAPCITNVPDIKAPEMNPEHRSRTRHLDLLSRPANLRHFKTRSAIIKHLRQFLSDRDFVEVETPILSSKAGGAAARPFVTRMDALGLPVYLRIAPELFLKQLIIGGFDRVFEIGKVFRNEGIDATHNPEFTSLEMYQSFASCSDMMKLSEELLPHLSQLVADSESIEYQGQVIDFRGPYKRISVVPFLEEKLETCFDLSNEQDTRRKLLSAVKLLGIRYDPSNQTLSYLFDKLIGHLIEPLCIQPTFIVMHPLIQSPLSREHSENHLLSARFELFVAGKELMNGYSELNNPQQQAERFVSQLEERQNGNSEAHPSDAEYVEAMKAGMPPTAGCGIGVDRLVMLLTNFLNRSCPACRDIKSLSVSDMALSARYLRGEIIAIKVVNLENDPEGIDEIRKEIGVLSNCDSPNIIRYRGSYLDMMGPLDETLVLFIAREVMIALSYLHGNSIIHRDIKAANILLTDKGEVKLGDFGVASQMLTNLRRNSFVGSPYWMAPEVIKRSQYDNKADIWSLGISLYELLKGAPPLANIEPGRAIFIIPKNAPPRLDSSFSQAMRDLVSSCLHDDPQKRPTADHLLKSKVFRGMKRGGPSPLVAVLEKYRNKVSNKDSNDGRSLLTVQDDAATVKSGWNFGTFRSEEYEVNASSAGESNSTCDETLSSTSQTQPASSTLLVETPTAVLPESPGLLRERSMSSLAGISEADSDLASSLGRSLTMSGGSLHHRKQPSILSFTMENMEDPLGYLDEMQTKQTMERNQRLQIYDWPFEIRDENRGDAFNIYKLMTMLKHSLLEVPAPPDVRASDIDVQRKIDEHKKYAKRHLQLIIEACQVIRKATGTKVKSNKRYTMTE
ncbi:Lysine--tRNA ligase [Paramicrosporidium saccamoebae]|uniref:Lysine--tRNA ligase n=1 Tax=Paramicrosporidium saccamoebae TaxID=1246581 RepID=A0A2H9TN48_9FUNG|nr:Lysine--tRNA ligase [Paramicrosporidium saccamoebae]